MELFALYRPGFPADDVNAIGEALLAAGVLIPGYIPPPVGLLNIDALDYGRHALGQSTIVLADRNLVSEVAKIARRGGLDRADPNGLIAARLMAFCQAMEIMIEPSIAYHELAAGNGNGAAHAELGWFRSADFGQAQAWIDLALGRTTRLTSIPAPQPDVQDLAFPLKRWRRNYAVALKIAELELAALTPGQRHLDLLGWMVEDFLFAGPAAIFAAMYFSPQAPRKGMFKSLRSVDRDRALAGVRNAAWDITALSDFVWKIAQGDAAGRRYMLATSDKALAAAAPLVLLGPVANEDQPSLAEALRAWWSGAEADRVAASMFDQIGVVEGRELPSRPADYVDACIQAGEDRLRDWTP